MIVKFSGKTPTKAHESDAGYDLCASNGETLTPRSFKVVSTGLKICLPKGHHADVRPRSGLQSKGIVAGYGLIDSGYRGEIKVILFNHTDAYFEIRPGDRIAQLTVMKAAPIEWEEDEKLPDPNRGVNGFGSSGR